MLITRSVISGTAREIGIRGSREGVTAVKSHWTEGRARRRKHAKSHGFGRGLSRGRTSETRVMPVSCLRRVRKKRAPFSIHDAHHSLLPHSVMSILGGKGEDAHRGSSCKCNGSPRKGPTKSGETRFARRAI